ncbi:DNA-directed RNA polymerase subunit L [Candidatus Woesearchaeota archaeon]|nr:DNA-directed RNA polymerase subunit L [Candidatus Woesearchaeota archaeon]
MEIKIVEESKNKMIIELKGETHTFCNALKKELWNDKHVKIAGYNIAHPLVGVPKIVVETDGKEAPKKALTEAAKRLGKKADKFKQAFVKGVKW